MKMFASWWGVCRITSDYVTKTSIHRISWSADNTSCDKEETTTKVSHGLEVTWLDEAQSIEAYRLQDSFCFREKSREVNDTPWSWRRTGKWPRTVNDRRNGLWQLQFRIWRGLKRPLFIRSPISLVLTGLSLHQTWSKCTDSRFWGYQGADFRNHSCAIRYPGT